MRRPTLASFFLHGAALVAMAWFAAPETPIRREVLTLSISEPAEAPRSLFDPFAVSIPASPILNLDREPLRLEPLAVDFRPPDFNDVGGLVATPSHGGDSLDVDATEGADLAANGSIAGSRGSNGGDAAGAGPTRDVRRLVDGWRASSRQIASSGDGAGAEFFGVNATGKRFVFVVDSSRSMSGTRWTRARRELAASVDRLDDESTFFVILFDATAHPMPVGDATSHQLIAATPHHVASLTEWLDTVSLGEGTSPLGAIRIALELQPDAVFLLSDGEFADPTAAFLRRNNVINDGDRLKIPGVPVHTIGLDPVEGRKTLERIARENGGEFRLAEDDNLPDAGPEK